LLAAGGGHEVVAKLLVEQGARAGIQGIPL
jgi:hypothetical protein